VAVGCGATGAREDSGVGVVGLYVGAASTGSTCFFSIVGGTSVVECLPVVHGGMARNSSKVRTRGLQHFQPVETCVSFFCVSQDSSYHDGTDRTYPSAPHGRLEDQGDIDILPLGPYTSCRTIGEHIFAPF
jgi:hypothetical protein